MSQQIDQRLESLKDLIGYLLKDEQVESSLLLATRLISKLREAGVDLPPAVSTPFINSIPADEEPSYPGDREIERHIKSYVRWNAMAMVVKANRLYDGIGGHISTFASCVTLYEVGFNHFFRGPAEGRPPDIIYFQGHSSPGSMREPISSTESTPTICTIFARSWPKAAGFRLILIHTLCAISGNFLRFRWGWLRSCRFTRRASSAT
jgi:hypothetical protein